MNKPIYLGIPILDNYQIDISKTLMYEFWYDYIKPKYQDRAELCCMNTDSFVVYIKIKDFYKDIANDVKNGLTHQTTAKMIMYHLRQAGMEK